MTVRTALLSVTATALLAAGLAGVPAQAAQAAQAVHVAQVPQQRGRDHAVCSSAGQVTAHCDAQILVDSAGIPLTGSTPVGLGPADLRSAYNLQADGTANQTIGIVDAYDDPNISKDLTTYSHQYGLPDCAISKCLKKVDQSGGTKSYPKANSSWGLEIALDVETAHGICPGCTILLVEAKTAGFTDLLAAEDYATAHATVVSNSWDAAEFSGETAYDGHFSRPGVPITVSSGDSGYGVEYPAASPNVIAVGGTSLARSVGGRGWTETAWSGSGSGCSAVEAKPTWQTDSGCAHRTVADVSADADPATGAAVYDSFGYGWIQVGGTSLASPLVASVYALAASVSGLPGAFAGYLYANASSLFDVTAGTNGSCGTYLCTAGPGYDGPTGLGTPDGLGAF